MTVETPLLTAIVATAGAVLIAVIGLIASVHYRLGKVEEGQKTLAQEDAHTREMVAQGTTHTRELIAQTQEMIAQGNAQTRELIAQTQEMAAQGDTQTRDMLTQEIVQTREMAAQGDTQNRELINHTRELIMQEIAASRERSDAQHAETMGAIQRLTDAFLSHSHDTDGSIRFSIPPPPSALPSQQPRTDDEA